MTPASIFRVRRVRGLRGDLERAVAAGNGALTRGWVNPRLTATFELNNGTAGLDDLPTIADGISSAQAAGRQASPEVTLEIVPAISDQPSSPATLARQAGNTVQRTVPCPEAALLSLSLHRGDRPSGADEIKGSCGHRWRNTGELRLRGGD